MPPAAAPGLWTPAHFACDNPSCGRLLCRPAVLNCGHVVCSPTCLGSGGGGGGSSGTQAAAPAEAAPRFGCPACGMVARQQPAVCKQLADLLVQLFPEESRRREQEMQAQLEAAAAAAVANGTGQPAAAAGEQQPLPQPPPQQQPQQMQQHGEPATPHASAAPSEGGPAAAGSPGGEVSPPAAGGGGQQQQAGAALSPSLQSALQRRAEAGGADEALARRLEQNLQRLTGPDYVHHGVGCDACGAWLWRWRSGLQLPMRWLRFGGRRRGLHRMLRGTRS